jgi:hypothetical protein
MADNEKTLDDFLKSSSQNTTTETEQQAETSEETNLEDEFAKLLNDFINQDNTKTTEKKQEQEQKTNSAIETSTNNIGLDSFVTTDNSNTKSKIENLDTLVSTPKQEEAQQGLKTEELELAQAVDRFQDGMNFISKTKNLKLPKTDYVKTMLQPNYKPSVGKKIAQYLVACWDIVNKYDPENMKRLSPTANDEEYLTFAESLNDTTLQLVIISYVEILINIEICEVNYKQKKEIILKNRIKKELYEEYQKLQERKNIFIKKLKEKKFPIDVDRLINNYFRAAQKDSKGAFEALTKNPATFSPIEFEKMHDRFFGLIKVTPEDGIKANQKIGSFIKKLKV